METLMGIKFLMWTDYETGISQWNFDYEQQEYFMSIKNLFKMNYFTFIINDWYIYLNIFLLSFKHDNFND